MRTTALATLLLLGACVHAPPQADPITEQHIASVIRESQRADPAIIATETLRKASEPEAVPEALAGIDLAKFELPVQYNERVQEYIDLYANRRRGIFTTWLGRMGRYRAHIETQLQAQGLPRELVYLPLIESAYESNAASPARAVGLWQFMPATARAEGLEVSAYVDERRDPIKSTEAALRHLSGLYNQFDSWYLTAAAYNSGSTRIARLLKERGYSKGQDDAFWALHDGLPRETRDYIPMLLAAVIVGENSEHFGLNVKAEDPVTFDLVTVGGATELRAVARAAGTSLDHIKSLNPQLLKGITPPDRSSEVRIPLGASAEFSERFASIPQSERVRPLTSTHVVKNGETLSGIARKYGTTVAAIKRLNDIPRPNAIAAGRKLVIPGT
jgi:membrane-bound lytic murein transglycosylase D